MFWIKLIFLRSELNVATFWICMDALSSEWVVFNNFLNMLGHIFFRELYFKTFSASQFKNFLTNFFFLYSHKSSDILNKYNYPRPWIIPGLRVHSWKIQCFHQVQRILGLTCTVYIHNIHKSATDLWVKDPCTPALIQIVFRKRPLSKILRLQCMFIVHCA